MLKDSTTPLFCDIYVQAQEKPLYWLLDDNICLQASGQGVKIKSLTGI